jgi:drug/metabolite transporter (DMT)-like permease
MFAILPWCFLVGTIVLAPLVWWHAPHGTLGSSPASWAALGYIGFIAGPLGTWCIMEATAKLPALVSSVGFLTTPAVSLILANIVLQEPFTPDLLAGSALIMAGVACAAWPQRRTA